METSPKLIIGLGNPGTQYERTRHNIGFLVLDELARRHGIAITKRSGRALSGDGLIGGNRVFLIKPQTFMNLSGEAVSLFLRQKPLPNESIMVVADDIALPLGKLRLRASGSAGGHNGLKSLIQHLRGQDFPRLRFGVGSPHNASVQVDYVLGNFSRSEEKDVEEGIERAVLALETWAENGLDRAMNQFNQSSPP